MVSTAHYGATEAGVRMLERGGNAIDAAVAAALALGVCEPAASGLGGQTMMLVHTDADSRTVALDGSSRAPNRAVLEAFDDRTKEVRHGYRATTVPSSLATYHYALSRFGRLKWGEVFEPAIALAEDGYEVSLLQYRLTRRERRHLKKHSAAQFFLNEGKAYRPGSVFTQPVLARTLKRIAEQGVEEFYAGETAELIERDMEANGGLLRMDDLAQIPHPIERRPLTGKLDSARVFTMPPPGAGRTLIEMMNVYQQLPPSKADLDTPDGAVMFAEIIQQAFLDRQDRPFDPNFYSQVSSKEMLRVEYARKVAKRLTKKVLGRGETTHLSVMDSDGNVVALTQSIENVYGSFCATADLGFLYNNYMNAFDYDDASHPYYMRPNAVPWASVAPTIVFRGRKPWIAIGSPGSERIAPSILQVLIRLRNSTPLGAVDAPRMHCSLDGKVSLEASRIRDDVPRALARHGFEVVMREPYSFYLGCVQMVIRNHKTGELTGVADPRRDGAAAGPGT
jgi:gamma-glutamyltranspeptidase/glutathione hydrolase